MTGNQGMTAAQTRLWFLQRLDSADASYNLHRVRRLTGPLDAAVLESAFAELAVRHESLRTRFPDTAGSPRAVVEPPGPVRIERIDLTGLAAAEREAQAERLVAERTNLPFDLAAAPPVRVTLLRLADDQHVLAVVVHHIIADGWSMDLLEEELARIYTARLAGADPALPPLPLRFADYAAEMAGREADPAALDYWRERLADPPVLELPADRPRPAERRGWGGELTFRFDGALAQALAELAKRRRCSVFAVLLTAYQVLLARHSGQEDVCVGVPDAGRDSTRLRSLVGNLAGMLVVRGDLSGDPTFGELLRRTWISLLEAMTRRDVPFERLADELDVGRDLSVTPFCQTTLTFHQSGFERPVRLGEATATPFPHGWHWVRCDLAVDLWWAQDGTGELVGVAQYSTELFDAPTVEGFFRRFEVLLRGVAADPGARISRLPIMDPAERELLVRGGNATAVPLPEGETLVSLFREQAARSPEAVAVRCGPRSLTYRELDEASTRLAARLRAAGAGPGTIVAVCLPRSADMPVALLGVLKAGAAYLPVDAEYPRERIAYVVADSGAALAVASADLRDRLPAGLPVLGPDDGAPATTPAGPPAPAAPRDVAYVLYTSGSTGRPKGVMVQHSALVNLLTGMGRLLGAGPRDVWLVLSSLSFDISALELYLPLINGGCAVIADQAAVGDGAALTGLIRDAGITHVQATPSGWRLLLEGGFAAPGVTGLVGGEALTGELARELRPRVRRLVNVYGPTETTIWSTTWEVPEAEEEPRIGGPIQNTQVYVLDAHGDLAPGGAPGELVIGGAGVAVGYLGRPALTAERFVPDPFGPPGSRLYRTGDRVRRRADGQLEFLGRLDNQVKIRGFRIEPGEIEAQILACPGVDQAAVVPRGDVLAAYLVGEADLAELRRELERTLPHYMLPSLWTRLPALPLTVSGKVDRKALPDPVPERAAEYVAPRTEAEQLVAQVWAELLDLERVGVHDDFFTIGGHSLIAVRVAARLGAAVGVEVPIRTLFTRRTVAELALAVEDLLLAELAGMPEEEAERLLEATDVS